MATTTRATGEPQSSRVKPGRVATARSSRRRRLRGTAVALLAALVCAWTPASASALDLSAYKIPFTPGDEKEVTAQWWFGARLSLSPGSVSENGGKQLVTVTAEVSEWGTSTSDLTYTVTVGKGGDGAVSGTDYHAVSKFNIVIKSGRRSGSNTST